MELNYRKKQKKTDTIKNMVRDIPIAMNKTKLSLLKLTRSDWGTKINM